MLSSHKPEEFMINFTKSKNERNTLLSEKRQQVPCSCNTSVSLQRNKQAKKTSDLTVEKPSEESRSHDTDGKIPFLDTSEGGKRN